MFSAHCPNCDRTVLLTPHDILGFTNDSDRIEVTYRCLCGAVNTWITGKRRSQQRTKVAARHTDQQPQTFAA